MTEEQTKDLFNQLNTITDNQIILGNKLNSIITKLDSTYSDVRVIIGNQFKLKKDHDDLFNDISKIKKLLTQK